jgi:DNA repair exonuclease SbcCD ATPase subunit
VRCRVLLLNGDGAGEGKTNLIQAIYSALTRKEHPLVPIQVGKDNAKVTLQVGRDDIFEYEITRTWRKGEKDEVKIFTSAGKAIKSPDKFLETLMGTSVFDLTSYLQLEPEKQLKKFKEYFNIDTYDLDVEIKAIYEERKGINSEVRKLNDYIESAPWEHSDLEKYKEKKDLTKLTEKMVANNQLKNDKQSLLTEANNKSEQIQTNLKSVKQNNKNVSDNEAEIERLKEQIKRLEEKNIELDKNSTDLETDIVKLTTEVEELTKKAEAIVIPDEQQVSKDFTDLTKFNQKVDDIGEYRMKSKELIKKRFEADTLTKKIEKLEADREKLIQEAQIPVPDLSFTEEYLTYKGLPLVEGQVNSATILEVLLRLFLKSNNLRGGETGKMNIFRLEGGYLDDTTFKRIVEVINQEDGQLFVELADDSYEGVEIKYIEDVMKEEHSNTPILEDTKEKEDEA